MQLKKKLTSNVRNVQPLQALSLVRRLIGSSGPSLIRANDGALYVVKTWGNRMHPNALANEFLGSAVCAAVGLPIPQSRPITLSPEFLDSANLSVLYEGYAHKPAPGLHYASSFVVPPPDKAFLIEHVGRNLVKFVGNRRDFLGMYLLDVCFMHRTRRQAVFEKAKDGPGSRAIFVDHDQMFGGSNWDFETALPDHAHRTASLYHGLLVQKDVNSWLRTFGASLLPAIDSAVKRLPSEWYAGDLTSLQAWLHHRIERLPTLVNQGLARAPIFREYVDATMHVPSSRICQVGT